MKNKNNVTIANYIIAVFLILIIAFGLWSWLGKIFDTSGTSTSPDNSKIEAYVMSQDFMKDYLTNPSTAKFPSYSKVNVIQTNNRYKVEGYVESQNSFGTTIKTNYNMILEKSEDGGWIKISCDT